MRQPDYKMVAGGNYQQHASPSIAGSHGKGLARLGRTLTDVGVDASQVVGKLHKAKEDEQMIVRQQQWEKRYAEHQKTMLDNRNDPLSWQLEWDKIAKEEQDAMDKAEVSRNLRGRMNQAFMRWNGGVSRSIGRRAHETQFRNTSDLMNARIRMLKDQGKYDEAREMSGVAVSKGYRTPAQHELDEYESTRQERSRDVALALTGNTMEIDQLELDVLENKGAADGMSELQKRKVLEDIELERARRERKDLSGDNGLRAMLEDGRISSREDYDFYKKKGVFKNISQPKEEALFRSFEAHENAPAVLSGAQHDMTELANDIDSGSISKKEWVDRYREIENKIESTPQSVQRGHVLQQLRGVDPLVKQSRAGGIAPDKYIQSTMNQLISNELKDGTFGHFDPKGGTKNNDALVKSGKLRSAIDKFIRSNPGAQWKDVQAHVKTITDNEKFKRTVEETTSSLGLGVQWDQGEDEGYFTLPRMSKPTPRRVSSGDAIRPDGTRKGSGFLGELKNSDGSISTEYSVQSDAVMVGGKRVDFPTLVPTLTKAEVKQMTGDIIPNKRDIPEAIMQKAIKHAKDRIGKGLSPFITSNESSSRMDSLTPPPNLP